jgi:F-box domain
MDSQNPNVFGTFDPIASSGYPTYNNSGNDRLTPANMASRRPRSSIADLPDTVLLRVLSHCDEEIQLEAALVCRSWLRFSRKVYFASYTIQSSADHGLLLLLLQPGYSVHAEYVTRLDVSFTSDESTSGATGFRRPPPHVSASDVHQLVLRLVNLDSLRADWIGARGSSTLKVVTSSPVPSASIPSFLTIPRVLQRLRHLEIRGGSWPLDSLLQSLAYMPQLINLTMENIYEPTSVAVFVPSMAPSYQLLRLTIGRCTLSGETLTWLLSTSQHTLRHFTINSLRRRPGSSSFNSALALVGPALETLRARNLELPRWDSESLLRMGLGYCPNLKILVVWCDTPLSSPFSAGIGGGSSQFPPSLANSLTLRSALPDSRPPSQSHTYSHPPQREAAHSDASPSLRSNLLPSQSQSYPHGSRSNRGYTQSGSQDFPLDINSQVLQSPLSPSSMSSSLPSPASQPQPGTMLPILMTVIQQEWLPNLTRLVIPPSQIESCLTRVECEAELLRRGITLDDTWG